MIASFTSLPFVEKNMARHISFEVASREPRNRINSLLLVAMVVFCVVGDGRFCCCCQKDFLTSLWSRNNVFPTTLPMMVTVTTFEDMQGLGSFRDQKVPFFNPTQKSREGRSARGSKTFFWPQAVTRRPRTHW